jgi:hypothetical protein
MSMPVSSEKIARPLETAELDTVRLDNIYHYEMSIKGGLPMNIPEADAEYTERKEAHLCFSGPTGMFGFLDC